MKKYLLAILVSACMFGSCRKNDGVGTLSIKVNGFRVTDEDMGGAKSVSATYLSVFVLDNSGQVVRSFYQSFGRDGDNLGTLPNIQLSSGNYRVVAVGQNHRDSLSLSANNTFDFNDLDVSKVFADGVDVTIQSGQTQNTSLMIDQRLSAFVLRLTQAPPDNVEKIRINLNHGGKTLSTQTFLATTDDGITKDVPLSSYSESNLYFFVHTNPQNIDINISALGHNDTVLYQVNLENLSYSPNNRKYAEGNLFSSTQGFVISTDDTPYSNDTIPWPN